MKWWEVQRDRATTAHKLVVPTPTLLEGLGFVVLWAEFTGRTA